MKCPLAAPAMVTGDGVARSASRHLREARITLGEPPQTFIAEIMHGRKPGGDSPPASSLSYTRRSKSSGTRFERRLDGFCGTASRFFGKGRVR